jgi:hypothetical protein
MDGIYTLSSRWTSGFKGVDWKGSWLRNNNKILINPQSPIQWLFIWTFIKLSILQYNF